MRHTCFYSRGKIIQAETTEDIAPWLALLYLPLSWKRLRDSRRIGGPSDADDLNASPGCSPELHICPVCSRNNRDLQRDP